MSLSDLSLLKRSTPRVADFVAFVADRETEAVFKRFVLDQAMPHVYVAIGDIDEAIDFLSKVERSPHFLMIDLHGSTMPLSDLVRLSQVCEPSVQVVALGERNDVGLFRSLLKIGIRDYLVKPLTVELLTRTINVNEQKINEVSNARVGKVIALAGARGGVGVTTVAVNLARHLAEETHRRIVYVDLNVHGGAANSMLGLKSNNGLIDVLQNVHRLDPQYVERTLVAKESHFFVLSADLDYRDVKAFVPGSLARILQLLSDSFHYVIMDAHDPLSPLAQEAFNHSTRAYLVADRTVYATRQTIRLIKHIEDRDNNPQTSIILNSPNAATMGKVDTADFAAAIGRNVLHEIRFESKILSIAENLGEAPKEKALSGFNQSILQIANDLTGQRQEKAPSLLERLMLRRV